MCMYFLKVKEIKLSTCDLLPSKEVEQFKATILKQLQNESVPTDVQEEMGHDLRNNYRGRNLFPANSKSSSLKL